MTCSWRLSALEIGGKPKLWLNRSNVLPILLLAKLPPMGVTSERDAAGLSGARMVDNYVMHDGNDRTFESPVIRAPQSFPNSLTMNARVRSELDSPWIFPVRRTDSYEARRY
jgi:hypothetical protein